MPEDDSPDVSLWRDECTPIAHEAELVAPRQNLASLSGAQRLAMALLREAIETVLALGPHHPDAVQDLAWIEGDAADLPFDLCALALGIEPDALRKLTRDALARRQWDAAGAARGLGARMAAIINHAPSVQWLASRLRPQLISVPVPIALAVAGAVDPALTPLGRTLLCRLAVREHVADMAVPAHGEWVDAPAWLCILAHMAHGSGNGQGAEACA